MAEPSRKISARDLIADIRAGMDDYGLIEKYQISANKLEIFLKMLVERGSLTQAELNDRVVTHSQNEGDGTQEVPFGSSPEPHDQFKYVAPPPTPNVQVTEQGSRFDNTWVFLVWLLGQCSWGLFVPIWFLWKKSKLNSLQSSTKLGEALATIALILSIGSLIGSYCVEHHNPATEEASAALAMGSLVFLIMAISAIVIMLILAFRVRRMLIDHCAATGRQESFSGILTFILNIAYLQYKMNRLYVTDEELGRDLGPGNDTVPRSRYKMVNDDR